MLKKKHTTVETFYIINIWVRQNLFLANLSHLATCATAARGGGGGGGSTHSTRRWLENLNIFTDKSTSPSIPTNQPGRASQQLLVHTYYHYLYVEFVINEEIWPSSVVIAAVDSTAARLHFGAVHKWRQRFGFCGGRGQKNAGMVMTHKGKWT